MKTLIIGIMLGIVLDEIIKAPIKEEENGEIK